MDKPVPADDKPMATLLEAGEMYWWCACGRSSSQPFCDGSHKHAGKSPLKFQAVCSERRVICICKRTATPPFCDGTHEREAAETGKRPLEMMLEKGEKYWWCACGLSASQPWCDGSHKALPE